MDNLLGFLSRVQNDAGDPYRWYKLGLESLVEEEVVRNNYNVRFIFYLS
jgi:hypothetical protein